jgi:hypothetical protein
LFLNHAQFAFTFMSSWSIYIFLTPDFTRCLLQKGRYSSA